MIEALRRPRWMLGIILVVVIAAVFVRLGFWQLDRLEERRSSNTVGEERVNAEPAELSALLDEAGDDLQSLEYRQVLLTGQFDTTEEVLVRSQVERGQAGLHVITPLVQGAMAVLVNRGWVPLSMSSPPVVASPQPGPQDVRGWVHLTQTRPPLGPEDPPGDVDVFNRVDIGRIEEQTAYELAPVYVVATGEEGQDLPVAVDPPDFTDEGPHLAYAIQWFGFAAVALIGFFFLMRSGTVSRRSPRD